MRRAVESGVDTQLIWAERGLLDEPQGLYDESRLRTLDLPAALRTREVRGSNHYSVILEPTAITALADAPVYKRRIDSATSSGVFRNATP